MYYKPDNLCHERPCPNEGESKRVTEGEICLPDCPASKDLVKSTDEVYGVKINRC